MKTSVFCLPTILTLLVSSVFSFNIQAQTKEFPLEPPPRDVLGEWGYTDDGTNWDTSPYLAFMYNNVPVRIMPPNDISYVDGEWVKTDPDKTYPAFLFLHGIGEAGNRVPYEHPIYGELGNNNRQLLHGGELWRDNVQSGKFDGFLIYPQSWAGWFDGPTGDEIVNIVKHLIEIGLVDANRVHVNGLSAGGTGVWAMAFNYPNVFASASPMSAVNGNWDTPEILNPIIHIPFWLAQGAKDTRPTPAVAQKVRDAFVGLGGDMIYKEYENLGHGTWYTTWRESDFVPFLLRSYKNNPLVYYQKNEFCPGDPVQVKLGLTPGFDGYEWRKDGNIIQSATGNAIDIYEFGTYEARIKRGDTWSPWSPAPIVVTEKGTTVTPPIAVDGVYSFVLPAPDGSTSVPLTLPDGYESYLWKNEITNIVVGAEQVYIATEPGEYSARVTERYGCSSEWSSPFKVVDASGANGPEAVGELFVNVVSENTLQLNWTENPAPEFNEDGFEIYRSENENGPFTFLGLTAPDVTSYNSSSLLPNTTYYFVIRAINKFGASELSEIKSATTLSDDIPPTVPQNLRISESTSNTLILTWDQSTDNIGVHRYDIYENGNKILVSEESTAKIYNLEPKKVYALTVRARDLSGNQSAFSEQVIGVTIKQGLVYSYFEGTWSNLPDFDNLTPVKYGNVEDFDISVRDRDDNFGFKFDGFISIPISGDYTFYTSSDDGSKLYINDIEIVNNDGLHGTQERSGSVNLSAGSHKITVTFFERGGGQNLTVSWSGTGISKQEIPKEALGDDFEMPGSAPIAGDLIDIQPISHKEISIDWIDNSDNETGFQILRSVSALGPFTPVAIVNKDISSYVDQDLSASTTYYYDLITLGKYGVSQANLQNISGVELALGLDNNLDDAYGNSVTSSLRNSPVFNSNEKVFGSHSLHFPGSNDYVDLDVGNVFIHNEFNQRAIAFWLKGDDLSGYQDVFDEGGATNGIGFRINNGSIEFGVRDDRRMHIISSELISGEWNHVVGIFDQGNMYLYVNNTLVNEKLNIGYTEVSGHSDGAGLGATNSGNAFGVSNNNFNGYIDDFGIYEGVLSPESISRLYTNGFSLNSATTYPLPDVPLEPSNLALNPVSATEIQLSWEVSDNSDGYRIYRSTDGTEFNLIATLSGETSYVNTNLYKGIVYYYRVSAFNEGGESSFSSVNGTTLNSNPRILAIDDVSMHYTEMIEVLIVTEDQDGDLVDLTCDNCSQYEFLTSETVEDGALKLTISPDPSNLGNYNLSFTAHDEFGGIDNEVMTLVIDDNYIPVISTLDPVTLSESETTSITISATDVDGDIIAISLADPVPGFVSLTDNGDGTGHITLSPGFNDQGTYTISIIADDNNGGIASSSVEVLVDNKINYQHIYVNFNYINDAPAPWNNTQNNLPVAGTIVDNLQDDKAELTGVEIEFVTGWGPKYDGVGAFGTQTGDDSGIYPDLVMREYYFTSEDVEKTFIISGLEQHLSYNIVFFGSREGAGDRTTVYTINGESVSLNPMGNVSNTVSLTAIPNLDGEISVNLNKIPSAPYGYLNAMEIIGYFDDGQLPLAPTDVSYSIEKGDLELSWSDNSENEFGFKVLKSIDNGISFTEVADLNPEIEKYNETGLRGNEQLIYKIVAYNSYGISSSEPLEFVTPNTAPSLDLITFKEVLYIDNDFIDFSFKDEEGDPISISSTLPDFVQITNETVESARLSINPDENDLGSYQLIITVTDDKGLGSSKTLDLIIAESIERKILVNFNAFNRENGPDPWNNFGQNPSAGIGLDDLSFENGENSGINITLLDKLSEYIFGTVTGDNSGIFPDEVMNTYFYSSGADPKRVLISGLKSEYSYDLNFFGSRDGTGTRNTMFSANGLSVKQNVFGNTSEIASINGLLADSNGEIQFEITPVDGAPYSYLNALVIEEVKDAGRLKTPVEFVANGISKNEIELSWKNEKLNFDIIEIHRSDGDENNFHVVSAIADKNSKSYVDSDVISGIQSYFYKIRVGTLDGIYSDFTPIQEANLIDYEININFNRLEPQAGAWNNTNSESYAGYNFVNLLDENLNSTGFSMEVVPDNPDYQNVSFGFDGDNDFGVVTGDDSGIVPDNVMKSFWFLENSSVSQLRFYGLNFSHKYNFVFFASRDGDGDRTTDYKIDETTVSLNASRNTQNVARINSVVPNIDGEVVVTLRPQDNALYGYINGLIIQAIDKNATESEWNSTASSRSLDLSSSIVNRLYEERVLAYPNPFESSINLDIESTYAKKVEIQLRDLSGSLIHRQVVIVNEGVNSINLNSEMLSSLRDGVYFLMTTDPKNVNVIKLVKD